MPTVRTFRDFFTKAAEVEIVCAIRGEVVRRLKLVDDTVTIDPMQGPTVEIPADTEVTYQPWTFDRGSLLFACALTAPEPAKICTELDLVRYPDGREESISHPDSSM